MVNKIRTRFAPSPTGSIHVGSVYSVLLDYVFAKKHSGKFILRIEDTDRNRFVKEAEEKLYEGLKWLGLIPDEGPRAGGPHQPYRQSERLDIYRKYALELVNKGHAYYCFCSSERLEKIREKKKKAGLPPMYDRHCRSLSRKEIKKKLAEGGKYVIRMKIPENQKIIVNDLLRGEISFESKIIDDQVLLKSDGFPTYHLAAVVDDHLMKISHVIRGEEWLSSAPKHVLLYQYFGWKPPVFIHTPILRNLDRSKLSKRQGHTSLFWYKEEGFLPEALLNFLALLGWSHPEEKEIFSLEEFIKLFDLKDLSPIGPVFNLEKLEWMNGVYIRSKSDRQLGKLLKPFLPELSEEKIMKAAPLIKERIKKLSEAKELLKFLHCCPDCPKELLLQRKITAEKAGKMVKKAREIIVDRGVEDIKSLQKALLDLVKKNGWNIGVFFMVFRVAICGKKITPPIVESLPILGKKEVLKRLDLALKKLD